jgi:hypothetical protein
MGKARQMPERSKAQSTPAQKICGKSSHCLQGLSRECAVIFFRRSATGSARGFEGPIGLEMLSRPLSPMQRAFVRIIDEALLEIADREDRRTLFRVFRHLQFS